MNLSELVCEHQTDPYKFQEYVKILKSAVENGEAELVKSCCSFDKICGVGTDKTWFDDIIDFIIKDVKSGVSYLLFADTYHGSWSLTVKENEYDID